MVDRRESAWTVLAAALALVVNLFVAGTANAALIGSPDLVICSGGDHRTAPDRSGDRPVPLDCCLAACFATAAAADLPAVGGLPAPPCHASVAAGAEPRAVAVVRHERSPIVPRGPPSRA